MSVKCRRRKSSSLHLTTASWKNQKVETKQLTCSLTVPTRTTRLTNTTIIIMDDSFFPDRPPGLAKRDQRIKCSSPKKRWGCLADIYSCSTSSRRANVFVKNIFAVILNSYWMMDCSTNNIWFAEVPIDLLSGLAYSPACFFIQLCLKLLPLVSFLKIHKFSRFTSFFHPALI